MICNNEATAFHTSCFAFAELGAERALEGYRVNKFRSGS